MTERQMKDVSFGKTPLGQLLYDLGFTKLSARYLARKHGMAIDHIRRLRVKVLRELRGDTHGENGEGEKE